VAHFERPGVAERARASNSSAAARPSELEVGISQFFQVFSVFPSFLGFSDPGLESPEADPRAGRA
jgi:hypothetical protein